jgi:SAM-dependent methyltransferase
MKLHELVSLRNLLNESIALEDIKSSTDLLLQQITAVGQLGNIDTEYVASVSNIKNYYTQILKLLDSPPKELQLLHSQIDDRISELTKTFNRRGYVINGFFASNATDVDGERNMRYVECSKNVKETVLSRIAMHSSWQYPGLEIGPGDGAWTPSLVASDPLYIIDNHDEFLLNTAKQFHEDYQRRMRKYQIDYRDNNILALPHNQFGFVFAWNVFNFFPHDDLRNYLKQVFTLLRPGGVLLFSYNNCDNPTQAGFAEEGWMSWIPRTMLQKLLDELGFEVVQFFEPELNTSFVEVKKPGIKTTAKAHQVLGEIKST